MLNRQLLQRGQSSSLLYIAVAECFWSPRMTEVAAGECVVAVAAASESLVSVTTVDDAGPPFPFLSGWSLVGWAPLSRVSFFDSRLRWPPGLA